MVHDPFRRHVRFVGEGTYEIHLKSSGWLDGVEPIGFGQGETLQLGDGNRKLQLKVRPRRDAPRELVFSVRPMGAPVWLEGTRDGRPLQPKDVAIAREGVHPPEGPLRLPEVRAVGRRRQGAALDRHSARPAARSRVCTCG